MGRYIKEARGEAEVGCLGRHREVWRGLRVRVVEVPEHVDGCGGTRDRAEVRMGGMGHVGQPGTRRKGS